MRDKPFVRHQITSKLIRELLEGFSLQPKNSEEFIAEVLKLPCAQDEVWVGPVAAERLCCRDRAQSNLYMWNSDLHRRAIYRSNGLP